MGLACQVRITVGSNSLFADLLQRQGEWMRPNFSGITDYLAKDLTQK
jgi:hypothetical protein